MEIFMERKHEAELHEILQTLKGMSEEEQKEMLVFLNGVALGRRLRSGDDPAA